MLIESDLIGNDSPFWTILNFVKNDIILGLVCIISSFVFLNRNNLAWSFFTASVIVHLLNILIVLKGASFEFFFIKLLLDIYCFNSVRYRFAL